VEKLQIILLFEGNFNNNNKWLGRAVMFNVEVHNLMAPEQYGSQKENQHSSSVWTNIYCMTMYDIPTFLWQSAQMMPKAVMIRLC